MEEKEWTEDAEINLVSTNPSVFEYQDFKDPYGYKSQNDLLVRLSRKIELATGYNVTGRFASSMYQV